MRIGYAIKTHARQAMVLAVMLLVALLVAGAVAYRAVAIGHSSDAGGGNPAVPGVVQGTQGPDVPSSSVFIE